MSTRGRAPTTRAHHSGTRREEDRGVPWHTPRQLPAGRGSARGRVRLQHWCRLPRRGDGRPSLFGKADRRVCAHLRRTAAGSRPPTCLPRPRLGGRAACVRRRRRRRLTRRGLAQHLHRGLAQHLRRARSAPTATRAAGRAHRRSRPSRRPARRPRVCARRARSPFGRGTASPHSSTGATWGPRAVA